MPVSNRLKNQHLLWRAAFGPMAENVAELDKISPKELWALLSKTSGQKPPSINVATNMMDGLVKGIDDLVQLEKLSKEQKKTIRQQSRQDLKNLNLRWLDEMIESAAQFREKMSLFWHGHFACRVINIYFQQQLLDIVRTNALGKFGDLLREVSKSPAMLQFLNNQQNRKQRPNENFAREVMELFTMGRGNYSEHDIKEAARAFTGWGFNLKGDFVFRRFQHDDDEKIFLGKKGNFDGDDIINRLLEQKQTATFITRKIYRYFVNENMDEAKVKWLSDRFYQSEYDIKKLMEDIFTSDWFYEEKNIGTRIKSPVELLVGIRRLLPLELQNERSQLLLQHALGQVLFYPPNVAGWPGGKSWIDSSTLMLRLRIPKLIAASETIDISPKNDDDVTMGQMMDSKMNENADRQAAAKAGGSTVNWQIVSKIFEEVPKENLLATVAATLLQTRGSACVAIANKYLDSSGRENYIRTAIIRLMSTPEYQLC